MQAQKERPMGQSVEDISDGVLWRGIVFSEKLRRQGIVRLGFGSSSLWKKADHVLPWREICFVLFSTCRPWILRGAIDEPLEVLQSVLNCNMLNYIHFSLRAFAALIRFLSQPNKKPLSLLKKVNDKDFKWLKQRKSNTLHGTCSGWIWSL